MFFSCYVTVNHYREVQQTTDNTTSLVALVVDDMNYTTAYSECTHHGYKLYGATPYDMEKLKKLYDNMQELTDYPVPTLYWVDSTSGKIISRFSLSYLTGVE